MKMNRFLKHLLFWLLYLLFEATIEFIWIKSSYSSISELARFGIAIRVELLLLIPKIFLTYTLSKVLLSFRERKNLIRLILLVLILFLLSLFLYRLISLTIILPYIYEEAEQNTYSILRLLTNSIDLVAVTGIFQMIKLYLYQLKTAQNEKVLIKAKLEAELNYLKSQTNPHFLFNTLNNIYGLSRKNPELSSDAIMKLSKVLRFMIYGTRKESILIEEEMEVIRNYIEIEKLRYANKLDLKLEVDIQSNAAVITPLILLPLVENAFKHGVAESTANAHIYISCIIDKENNLLFTVNNSKEIGTEVQPTEGIGLANIKRQLHLLYSNYQLNILENDDLFEVKLHINLNSYEAI